MLDPRFKARRAWEGVARVQPGLPAVAWNGGLCAWSPDRVRAEAGGMGWAAEFSVPAGCPGKGKLTFVKSPASAYLIPPPEQPYGVGVTSLVWLQKL